MSVLDTELDRTLKCNKEKLRAYYASQADVITTEYLLHRCNKIATRVDVSTDDPHKISRDNEEMIRAAYAGQVDVARVYAERWANDWEGGFLAAVQSGNIALIQYFIYKGARSTLHLGVELSKIKGYNFNASYIEMMIDIADQL